MIGIVNPFRAGPFSLARENHPLFGEKRKCKGQRLDSVRSLKFVVYSHPFFPLAFASWDAKEEKSKTEKEKIENVKMNAKSWQQ